MNRQVKSITILFFVFIFVFTSCTLPWEENQTSEFTQTSEQSEQGNSTQSETVTESVQQEVIEQDLPPVLIQTFPAQYGTIPASGIEFVFNQEIDLDSFENSFQSIPQLSGTFSEGGSNSVFFVPNDLPAGETIYITLSSEITALNGLSMLNETELTFRSPTSLQIAERIPDIDSIDINPSLPVYLTFNQPVISIDEIGNHEPAAFELEQDVPGESYWLNTSTYAFFPETALPAGSSITININPNLTSTWGSPLSLQQNEQINYSFNTSLPSVLSFYPETEIPLDLDTDFVLTFNQPMNPSSVESLFTLKMENGELINGTFSWDESFSELTFSPADILPRNETVELEIQAGASSIAGASLPENALYILRTSATFEFINTTPSQGEQLEAYGGYGALQVRFSTPLANQVFEDFVQVSPNISELSVYSWEENVLTISGFFNPQSEYRISIDKDLTDRWGDTLDQDIVLNIETAAARPSFVIPILQYGTQSIFLTSSDTEISARVTNINQVNISVEKITPQIYIELIENYDSLNNYPANNAITWQETFQISENYNQPVSLPLHPEADSLEPGLYFYRIQSEDLSNDLTFLASVSDYQITIKRSENNFFLWAVDLTTMQPAGEQSISLLDENGLILQNTITNEDGISQITIPENINIYDRLYVQLGEENSSTFGFMSDAWNAGISGWDFGLQTELEENNPFIYLYTDRPIYKPGDIINYKVIVKKAENGRYFPSDLSHVTVQLYGAYSEVTGQQPIIEEQKPELSPYGTAEGSIKIPEDGATGQYFFNVVENNTIWLPVQVATYRKPEIELSIGFDKEEYQFGETINIKVESNYYFGAAAADLPITWTLTTRDGSLSLPYNYVVGGKGVASYQQTNAIYRNFNTMLANGTGRTDENGQINIVLNVEDLSADFSPETIQNLTLEATIEDESQFPVSQREEAVLHPELFYIGVRPDTWMSQAGEEISFAVQTTDWDERVSAKIPLVARFYKVSWERSAYDQFGNPAYEPVLTEVSSANFTTNEKGQARLAFTAEDPGVYQLEVSGEQIVTRVIRWVGGQGTAAWPRLPNQQLILESENKTWQPGETVEIFIPNPYNQTTQALITLERHEIMRTFTIELPAEGLLYSLPLSETDAPTVYLSALILGYENGRPDFRLGYEKISVNPENEILQVDLQFSSEETQPGEEVEVSIRVTDRDGNPVNGEFSLALIDKAIYALSDPNTETITETFYGQQSLGIKTALSLSAYSERIPNMTADGIGGGGKGSLVDESVRDQYEDTAFWNGIIETDENGQASIKIKLPDNLTTWVADLRGLTADNKVGEASAEVVTSKEVMVRPVVPRFLTAGDHVQLSAIVNNQTGESAVFDVSIAANGFILDDPTNETQRITIDNNGQAKVNWWGTTSLSDEVDVTFTAQTGSYTDAAKPETGSIPILKVLSPAAYNSGGILENQGEWLEVVSLPETADPESGNLQISLSPTMTTQIIQDIEFDTHEYWLTETRASRLVWTTALLKAVQEAGISLSTTEDEIRTSISKQMQDLSEAQNFDGGWGWYGSAQSDPFITAYVLYSLQQGSQLEFSISTFIIEDAVRYIENNPAQLSEDLIGWELDQKLFIQYALWSSGYEPRNLEFYEREYEKLNSWSLALLVEMITDINGSQEAAGLFNILKTKAIQISSGAFWKNDYSSNRGWNNQILNTALAIKVLSQNEIDSPLLINAVRYLSSHRQMDGLWLNSFDSAWAVQAMVEYMLASGEYLAAFDYNATFNETRILEGSAGTESLSAVQSSIPVSEFQAGSGNMLKISRSEGEGILYFRNTLNLFQTPGSLSATPGAVEIDKKFIHIHQDCELNDCEALETISLADTEYLDVVINLTVSEDTWYLVVTDWFPAGTEPVDQSLQTSQQIEPLDDINIYERNWMFGDPAIYEDHVEWIVRYVPAGSYTIHYRIHPFLPGEFQIIPTSAHAWYFPEMQGSSQGYQFSITD